MSRYYQDYDAYGEPLTIIPEGRQRNISDEEVVARFEREARKAIDAEEIYDRARHAGLSDSEARALVRKELARD